MAKMAERRELPGVRIIVKGVPYVSTERNDRDPKATAMTVAGLLWRFKRIQVVDAFGARKDSATTNVFLTIPEGEDIDEVLDMFRRTEVR